METNLDHIFVFKTNISVVSEDCMLRRAFENHPDIDQWSVDCEDTDCVLRIVSPTLSPRYIERLVNLHGFDCTELD